MFFVNKNVKVINWIEDYYEGKVNSIPYSAGEVEKAINYTKKYRSDYPDEVIEKLRTVKVMLDNA
ncbi:hypothetical protein [Fulvivirga lutea]|uniref:Uncharacterized protein n=1 Tax=Fulvivirga lutea TaxID=2810512 RepID=A0A974ZZF0_9BACT|nr:hypothetical protein [Fulvivirga lutea]QSE96129.1 hypothetical protein JR347_10930 [Fulvivirga lutea]